MSVCHIDDRSKLLMRIIHIDRGKPTMRISYNKTVVDPITLLWMIP